MHFAQFRDPIPFSGERDGLKNLSVRTPRSLIFPLNEQTCSIEKEEDGFGDSAFAVGSSSFPRGRVCAVAERGRWRRCSCCLCSAARVSPGSSLELLRFAFLCGCDAALSTQLALSQML